MLPGMAQIERLLAPDERVHLVSREHGIVLAWPFLRAAIAAALAAAAAIVLGISLLASIGGSRPKPTLNLVVQEVGPESQRTFKALVPRYDDVDAATAMVDTMFRSDY